MEKYDMTAGVKALDALQRLWQASSTFESKKFTKEFTKAIHELDDKRTIVGKLSLSPKADADNKHQLANQMEEIQLVFTELNRMAECIYDMMKNYPGKMPVPLENAWAIFCKCLWSEKEILPFIFGFRAGNVFTMKYGNSWGVQPEKKTEA